MFKYLYIFTDEDLIVEMLEVFINNILYVRRAYPNAIFQRQKMYNTLVYTSIYPPLNEYISNVLKSALALMKSKQLKKLEIVFYIEQNIKLETFIFEFENLQSIIDMSLTMDEYYNLSEFEEKMRSLLLTLDNKCKNLQNLPSKFNFKINLHTTQAGFVKITDNVKLQVCV